MFTNFIFFGGGEGGTDALFSLFSLPGGLYHKNFVGLKYKYIYFSFFMDINYTHICAVCESASHAVKMLAHADL